MTDQPQTAPTHERASHPLRGLLVAQFLGAFNDNAWKLFVALLAMRSVLLPAGTTEGAVEAVSQFRTTLTFVTFTLPLMLFSLPAGALADRVSKRTVILAMKGVEILLMGSGTLILLLNPDGWLGPIVVLGLMGAQSALFSPAKYGILPEILPHRQLSAGNGQLEMWTFMAIIAGTASGGLLMQVTGGHAWRAGLVLTCLAGIGFLAARDIPPLAASRTEGGMAHSMMVAWRALRSQRVLGLAVLGSTLFWGIASLLGQDILVHAKAFLKLSDFRASSLLAVFGLGVGTGGFLAGRVSGGKVEVGLIPLGAIGLSFFTVLLCAAPPSYAVTLLLLVLTGVASGLLVVPLNALLQWRAPEEIRGAVIALANVFVFAGVLLGSLVVQVLSSAGLTTRQILLSGALLTVSGTAIALRLLPGALLRLILILLTHTLYRLKILDAARVPEKGGALLVPNHVSFVDGLFLIASLDRPVRFMVDAVYFNHPLLKPFMQALEAIPISDSGGPRPILRAFREAGRFLDEGHLVCIFAEGQITRTGMLLPFRRGLEKIARGRTIPIIPVHLDRVWGSLFSPARGGPRWRLPRKIPYPVTVSFGEALPADTPLYKIRQAVSDLDTQAWMLRKSSRHPLHRAFVRLARRHPLSLAFADASFPALSRFRALTGSVALARRLRDPWREQTTVGVLLPPSVAAALANLAATLSGRISVNLNYTAGRSGMESAARQAGLQSVITSRRFLKKAGLSLPQDLEPIWMEDLAASLKGPQRLAAFLLAAAAPVRCLERLCGRRKRAVMDDTATVIFSSGSTGEPKGVMLTHFNIDSNVEAAAQVFRFAPTDRVMGILPLFHSFGYLLLWFAASQRIGMVFHPDPTDAAAIGTLVERYHVTFLLATPTFLQLYMRRCRPGQFGSLRLVLAGAERLTEAQARAFQEKFGLRPLEGYGTTECSPAVAVSVQDHRSPGLHQAGSRPGFVGQPLPGVSVRVVDPDTGTPLPPGRPGLLLVKGPNVMKGYMGRPDLTASVLRDGWYVTGDMAVVNEDGFVRITDRLSRFAKIGGEMVPHGKVEAALQEAAGADHQVFAVTSIPDARRGERLAVLHTLEDSAIPGLRDRLAASGLPNLFIPRLDAFLHVDKLPVLGTGKLDLRALKDMATARLGLKPKSPTPPDHGHKT